MEPTSRQTSKKKKFGFLAKDGLIASFFGNDWLHGVFVDENRTVMQRHLATGVLGAEMLGSAATLFHYQAQDNQALTATAMYSLLFTIMMLSNATKNQRDLCSKYLHSVSSKLHHAFFLLCAAFFSESLPTAGLGTIFGLDALFSVIILWVSFAESNEPALMLSPRERQIMIQSNNTNTEDSSRYEEKEEVPDGNQFNSRLPSLLREDELSQRLVGRGWKFDLFNTRGQLKKQLAAVGVIFGQLFFALCGIVDNSGQSSYSSVVLVYSLICLFSMLNISYVRDFDALQVNLTPIMLALTGMMTSLQNPSAPAIGLTISTGMDAYFALRYRESTDHIDFSPVERFAMESWTQEAFVRDRGMTLQTVSTLFIFAEMYMGMVGIADGHHTCIPIMIFALMRLLQFFCREIPAVNMAQSNFTAVALSGATIYEAIMLQSPLLSVAAGLLSVDAALGTSIFVSNNAHEIAQFLRLQEGKVRIYEQRRGQTNVPSRQITLGLPKDDSNGRNGSGGNDTNLL